MIRYGLFLVLVALTGYGCILLGARAARAVEALLAERSATGLGAVELDWVTVRADGLRLELRGNAPDVFARDLALETVRATAPIALVIDHTTVHLAPPPRREPIAVEILRDERGLTLTGRFQGPQMQTEMVLALRSLLPGLEIHDLTGANAARPPRGWGPELTVAALAAARVPNAYIRLTPGEVQIDGSVRDAAHREAVALELLSLAGDAVSVVLSLSEPPHAMVPYAFAVTKDTAGGIRVEACAARNSEEQAVLQAALNRHGHATGEVRCPVAVGGPSGDWPTAAIAGLDALARLPAGHFRLEYHSAELEAEPPTTEPDFVSALAGLAAALPGGYGLMGAIGGAAAGETAGAPAPQRYWMRITRDVGGVSLSGTVPGLTEREVIAKYAAARHGARSVSSTLVLSDAQAVPGWEAAALAALDALTRVERGAAELAPGMIAIEGWVAAPEVARTLHAHLEGEAPEGYVVETALGVDLPALVAARPLDPVRCARVLGDAVRARPIEFAPGSAVFEDGSDAVLDRLAAILERCPEGRVEVGGHTDSQGSEELNQRLSRARADAVLDALIARGAPLGRLAAEGYGESRPVASNATEAGRGLNRRIAFSAVE